MADSIDTDDPDLPDDDTFICGINYMKHIMFTGGYCVVNRRAMIDLGDGGMQKKITED